MTIVPFGHFSENVIIWVTIATTQLSTSMLLYMWIILEYRGTPSLYKLLRFQAIVPSKHKTFVYHLYNVDVGLTLYKCYTYILRLLGMLCQGMYVHPVYISNHIFFLN